MLPVILWQDWETLEDDCKDNDEEATKIDHKTEQHCSG
jgi:hypothetical protein